MKKNSATKFSPSIRALSKRTNIDRTTINRYLALPGAPTKTKRGFHVESVLTWISQNAGSFKTLGAVDPAVSTLRVEELKTKVEHARFKMERDRGDWFPRSEVLESLRIIGADMQQLLTQRLVHELPVRLQGLDVIATQEVLRGVVHDVTMLIHTGRFKPTEPAQPQPAKEAA